MPGHYKSMRRVRKPKMKKKIRKMKGRAVAKPKFNPKSEFNKANMTDGTVYDRLPKKK